MSHPSLFGGVRSLLHDRAYVQLAALLLDVPPDLEVSKYIEGTPELGWARAYVQIDRMTPQDLGGPVLEHLTFALARWREETSRHRALEHFQGALPRYLEVDRAHPQVFETLMSGRLVPEHVGGLYLCTARGTDAWGWTLDALLSERLPEVLWVPEATMQWTSPDREPATQILEHTWVCDHRDLELLDRAGLPPETMQELRPRELHHFSFTNLTGHTCTLALMPHEDPSSWLRLWMTRDA